MTLSNKTPEIVKYPNQPLVEVTCEIRFFGEPSVETKRDLFYEKVRADYPLIFVPSFDEAVHPALQHYRFEKENRESGVQLALNSFSYYQRDYEGVDKYIAEVMRLFEVANSIFKIQKFTRIGWRYINVLPFVRVDRCLPLSSFFENPPGLFSAEPDTLQEININLLTRCDSEDVRVKLVSDGNSGNEEVLILDIDVYRNNINSGLEIEQVEQMLRKSHCVARNFFESSISDDYRSYLEGDI